MSAVTMLRDIPPATSRAVTTLVASDPINYYHLRRCSFGFRDTCRTPREMAGARRCGRGRWTLLAFYLYALPLSFASIEPDIAHHTKISQIPSHPPSNSTKSVQSVASEESKSIPPARPRESGGTQKEHTASRAREELNSGRITRTLESRSTRSHSSKSYTHMKDAKRTISEQSIHTMKAKVKAETDSEVGKKEVVVKPDHVSQPNARVDGMGKIIEHSSSAKKERVKAETDSDVGEKVGKTVEHSSSAEKERAKAETDSEVGEKEVAVKPQRSKVPDTSKALASPPEENKDVKKETQPVPALPFPGLPKQRGLPEPIRIRTDEGVQPDSKATESHQTHTYLPFKPLKSTETKAAKSLDATPVEKEGVKKEKNLKHQTKAQPDVLSNPTPSHKRPVDKSHDAQTSMEPTPVKIVQKEEQKPAKKDSTDKILSSNKDDEKKGNILPKREKSPPPERVQNNTDKKENGKILSKQQKSPSPAPAKKRTDTKETHPKPVKKTAKSAPAKKPVKDTMPSWDVTYAPTVVELPPPALGAPSPLGGPPAAVEEDKRSCRLLGFTPTVQTCGFMALSLIIAGLLTTFWTTKSEGALAFWVGFVCGCILVLIGGKAFFNLTDDDIVLLIGLTVGLLVGIASLYFIWIAHTLSTLMVVGLVIYSAVRFGPYLIRQFGNHWWLWCLSFLLILPIIIFGWNLYRVLAHFVKTALGALLITVGVEYFLNAYTTLLNPKFHILRLVDGSRLDCHGGTCVGEMSFWIIVTLIGSFVHNFGISEFHSFKRKSRSRSPSEAESEQKLFSPSTEKDPMNYSNQRSYNSTGQTSNRSPFGKEIAGGNGDHLYSSAYKSINLQK